MPSVDRLHRDFRAKGLAVYLVNFRESAAVVTRAVRERGYTAPVLLDESGETTGKAYGVWAPPTFYFLDREGRLVGRAVGPRSWDRPAAREFIQALVEAGGKS